MAGATALRFGKHLKELRIHLCQTSQASKGVRLMSLNIVNFLYLNVLLIMHFVAEYLL